MNFQRSPEPRSNVPAPIEQTREVDLPYRGGYGHEPESAGSLRYTLVRYLNLALKYKWLIAACAAVSLLYGFINTLTSPKIFSASTTVRIERAAPKMIQGQRDVSDYTTYDPNFYNTQFELIRSRAMAERVASALNIGATDFLQGPPPSLWSRLLGRVSGPPGELDPERVRFQQGAAVGAIQGGLSIQPVPTSNIIRIRFTSQDPRWAQRISIAVAEQYERFTLDRRYGAAQQARAFLEERLQELKEKIQTSERQLIEYAQREGIVSVDEKQPQAPPALVGVQSALATAVAERIRLEQAWEIAKRRDADALPQIMKDGGIQALREKVTALRVTYQEKLSTLKPAFPEMVALRTQMSELERQIRLRIDLIIQSVREEYEAAKAQETALQARLEEVKAEVLDVRSRSVEYNMLMRELDTSRTLYDGLLQQFRELAVVADAEGNNVSIIDRALLPTVPDAPSLRRNLFMALLFGLIGACGIIAIREIMDDTFKSVEDVEEGLGLPVLGISPLTSQGQGDKSVFDHVRNDAMSPAAEAFRSLRTALQFSTEDGAPRTLLVTSSRPGEGKSTASACLALKFSQLGMKVLLIDADLRNASMHRIFGQSNTAGLSNFLSGADETELVKSTDIPGVTIMTSGPLPPNPAELLAGLRFVNLLALATENFDIVIIDGPPIMGLADAPIISRAVAGTLLVIEAGGPRRAIVRDALKRLEFARARVIGVLLNKFDVSKTGFAYNYHYQYDYSRNAQSSMKIAGFDLAALTGRTKKADSKPPGEAARGEPGD